MDFSQEMMTSVKAGDLAGIQAELIGCLDEDEKSQEPPQTLALAEALAKKLPVDLFEEDNGNFNFASVSMNKDGLRQVKGRLRINFSKEKLALACKIIASLKGSPESTGKSISDSRPVDTARASSDVATTSQPETKPVQEAVTTSSPTRSPAPEPARTKSTESSDAIGEEKGVSEQAKTPDAPVEKATQAPAQAPVSKDAEASERTQPQMLKQLSVPEPEQPSAPEPERPSFEKVSSTKSTAEAPPPRSQTAPPRPQSAPQKPKKRIPGYWERKFAAAGRRIDEFLKRLFGR